LIAVLSLTLFPVTDSFAATKGDGSLIHQARAGKVAIISQDQMTKLEKSRPALYAKLQTAVRNQVAPNLTRAEISHLRQLTLASVKQVKAGQAPAEPAPNTPGGPIVVAKPAAEATDTTVWANAGKCVASAATLGAAVAVALPIAGIPVALIITAVGVVGCGLYFFFPLIHDWVGANVK
jgi:hypothetical protein